MSDIIPEGILYGNLGVGSGTTNYNDLDNKPQINSVTLQGNKTASELGLVGTSDIPVTSVNGETGAVVLDGTEIEFSTGVSINEKILAVEQEIPVIAYPVTSVNGETGAVVLDGTEINYQAGKTINQKIDEVEAEIPIVSYPVTSVNGETGAVVLDGTDIEYSSGVSVNSQIDTLMNYIPVYGNTASGAIATFDTSLALPLQDLQIAIDGTDLSGANIHNGINLYNPATITTGKYINGNGEPSNSFSSNITDYIAYSESTLTIKADFVTLSSGNSRNIGCYNANKEFIAVRTVDYNNKFATVSIPANTAYIIVTIDKNITDLFIGSTSVTAIDWQTEAGTVSEGSLDVTTGKLTVVNGSMGEGVYQITPIPINQLSGTNNIFCDTGDTSVVYACSLKDYIDSQ